jgi:hypothetical protein
MKGRTFNEQYEKAKKAGERANQSEPRAVSAQYDSHTNLIIIYLRGGNTFSFSPKWVPGLREASATDLSNIEITPSGAGLHWENLDEDLSVPALLQGNFGPAVAGAGSIPVDTELFENLCVQIEIAWNTNNDASVVDRLASEYPDLSADLYDFLTLLVETDLMEPEAGASRQTAENTLAWLEKEGFEIVHNIVREQREVTTNTTSLDSIPSQPNTTSSESINDESVNSTREPKTYKLLAKEQTGFVDEEIDEKIAPISVIEFVQKQPPGTYKKSRERIIQNGKQHGVDENEGNQVINTPLRFAARRRTNKKKLSLREVVKKTPMTPENRKIWLDIAKEDEGS